MVKFDHPTALSKIGLVLTRLNSKLEKTNSELSGVRTPVLEIRVIGHDCISLTIWATTTG